MDLTFPGEVIEWRGPAPFYFVVVPPQECEHIADLASMVSYGWGVIPVTVRLGRTEWTTSLFPKEGGYLVPVKDKVRRAEQVEVGDVVTLDMTVGREDRGPDRRAPRPGR